MYDNLNCIFRYSADVCRVFDARKNCDKCSFCKTREQATASRVKAAKRLHSLPQERQIELHTKYHKIG